MPIAFTKMHGIGNDFVLIDAAQLNGDDPSALSKKICDRKFGIGSDGLISVSKESTGNFRMRMWNPDGSESEMCGNGVRCFAKYVREQGLSKANSISVESGAGLLQLEILEDCRVRVDMGLARRAPAEIGMAATDRNDFVDQPIEFEEATLVGTAVSMGNPHLVIFVDDVSGIPLEHWGPKLERNKLFPNRVNVHFAQADSDDHITMRTWERGAGATLACGTGACSVAVAGFLTSRTDRKVCIKLPGGELEVDYLPDGHVMMTGTAETVFVGEWPTTQHLP